MFFYFHTYVYQVFMKKGGDTLKDPGFYQDIFVVDFTKGVCFFTIFAPLKHVNSIFEYLLHCLLNEMWKLKLKTSKSTDMYDKQLGCKITNNNNSLNVLMIWKCESNALWKETKPLGGGEGKWVIQNYFKELKESVFFSVLFKALARRNRIKRLVVNTFVTNLQ